MLAYQPVRALSTLNMTIKSRSYQQQKELFQLLIIKIKLKDKKNAKPLNQKNSDIKFINLNFAYEKKKKSFKKYKLLNFEGGKMTSLVGHSGSGKSTILNLIPRFYNADAGDIQIDGQSIYKIKFKSLRENISLVSQETTLFDDTILNNIKYSNENASNEEIYKVAKLSNCAEFINKLPNKYETIIGENGIRLSGGEKQRIAIARAMMKKSSIILLDEATSSLDSETETKIQEALKILKKIKPR